MSLHWPFFWRKAVEEEGELLTSLTITEKERLTSFLLSSVASFFLFLSVCDRYIFLVISSSTHNYIGNFFFGSIQSINQCPLNIKHVRKKRPFSPNYFKPWKRRPPATTTTNLSTIISYRKVNLHPLLNPSTKLVSTNSQLSSQHPSIWHQHHHHRCPLRIQRKRHPRSSDPRHHRRPVPKIRVSLLFRLWPPIGNRFIRSNPSIPSKKQRRNTSMLATTKRSMTVVRLMWKQRISKPSSNRKSPPPVEHSLNQAIISLNWLKRDNRTRQDNTRKFPLVMVV